MARTEYANPFDIGNQSAEVKQDLTTRADLMIAIRDYIDDKGWDQKEAAHKLKTNQPRISNLMNGHIEKFSTGMLIDFLERIDIRLAVQYRPEDAVQFSATFVKGAA